MEGGSTTAKTAKAEVYVNTPGTGTHAESVDPTLLPRSAPSAPMVEDSTTAANAMAQESVNTQSVDLPARSVDPTLLARSAPMGGSNIRARSAAVVEFVST